VEVACTIGLAFVVEATPAFAAQVPKPGPETLWRAFPLVPRTQHPGHSTSRSEEGGRRVVRREGVARPQPSKKADRAVKEDVLLLVAVVAALPTLAFLLVVGRRRGRSSGTDRGTSPSTAEPSASISAVFVDGKWLRVIESKTGRPSGEPAEHDKGTAPRSV
jgi:hypothetical protein